ncbi:MAG: lipoate--protein ligase family protein [Ignavibacteriales bacterium]|nr:lipoate--protein ligase family protein [Ignavibacteriales bacterium]
MDYDERLAQSLVSSDGPCVVRFYGWKPPAISLGWHQEAGEIDLAKCHDAGIDVVRRPTGGRAILHSDEVTYSVVMTASQKSVLSVYQRISEALVKGLRSLGADVALEKSQPHFPSLYRSSSSVACFASAARYEIHVAGRKLVGSAQRRFARPNGEEVVLQHGSILLGPDHLRIVDFLTSLCDDDRVRLKSELSAKTTDLASTLERRVEYDDVVAVLKKGFEEMWQITFESLVPEEAEEFGSL